MAFTPKTIEELIDDAIFSVAKTGGPLNDFTVGSINYTLLRALASVLSRGYVDMQEAINASFLATATGDYLTRHVADFGLTRSAGTYSEGAVIAIAKTGATPFTMVPGSVQFIETNKLYVNTTQVTLTPPYTLVPIKATKVGNAYDLPAGTILKDYKGLLDSQWQFAVGTDGFNAQYKPIGSLRGGSDPETDAMLRLRFRQYINSLSRSTESAVRAAVGTVPDVASYQLVEFDPGVGWFTVYVDDGADVVNPATLSAVDTALRNSKALGIAYKVKPMVKQFVDMEIQLRIDGNYPAQPIIDTAKTTIRNTLAAYNFGDELTLAQIIAACKGPNSNGVIDVNIIAPTANVVPNASTALRAGALFIKAFV